MAIYDSCQLLRTQTGATVLSPFNESSHLTRPIWDKRLQLARQVSGRVETAINGTIFTQRINSQSEWIWFTRHLTDTSRVFFYSKPSVFNIFLNLKSCWFIFWLNMGSFCQQEQTNGKPRLKWKLQKILTHTLYYIQIGAFLYCLVLF